MAKKVNAPDLLREVSEKTGKTLKDTNEFYDAFLEAVREHIKKDEKVALSGFGNFYPSEIKAKEVVLNGEKRKVEAHTIMKFSASKTLNNKINE